MASILRCIPAAREDYAEWVDQTRSTYFAVKGKLNVEVGDYLFVVWKNSIFAAGIIEDIEDNGKRRLDFLQQGNPREPEAYQRLYVYRLFKFGRRERFESFTGIRYLHRAFTQRDWCKIWLRASRLIGKPEKGVNYGIRGKRNGVASRHSVMYKKMLDLSKSFKDFDRKKMVRKATIH